MCTCEYIQVSTCEYMFVHVNTCEYTSEYKWVHVSTCVYILIYKWVHVSTCEYMLVHVNTVSIIYKWVHVCTCECMWVHVKYVQVITCLHVCACKYMSICKWVHVSTCVYMCYLTLDIYDPSEPTDHRAGPPLGTTATTTLRRPCKWVPAWNMCTCMCLHVHACRRMSGSDDCQNVLVQMIQYDFNKLDKGEWLMFCIIYICRQSL